MTLHTQRYFFLSHPVLEKGISYTLAMAISGKPDTIRSSILRTKRYCSLTHSVLGEGVSPALAMPISCGTGYCIYQLPFIPNNIVSLAIRSHERVLANQLYRGPVNALSSNPAILSYHFFFFFFSYFTPHSPSGIAGEPVWSRNSRTGVPHKAVSVNGV